MSFTGGAILIAVAVPILFFLVVWVGVTASRILYPERPLPFLSKYKTLHCFGRFHRPHRVIGAHQIRARHRAELGRQEHAMTMYERGLPESIPGTWKEELWERRN